MAHTLRRTPRVVADIDQCARLLAACRRILVLGSSGSGKTTFARGLAQRLAIGPIHLDAHFWQPGWVPTEAALWRERVASLVAGDAWIMDGTYEGTLDLRIPAADAVVVIEANRWACLWRVLKRKWTIADAERPDAPPGQPIDRPFLRYIWNYPRVTRPLVERLIEQYGGGKMVVVVRGGREARWNESEGQPGHASTGDGAAAAGRRAT